MNGHKEIGEIRGIESAQSLEEKMESILVKKLKEMKFVKKADIDKNMKIIQDLRELSTIAQEIDKNNDLNLSEIYNLFEIKVGFGWENDPRVEKLQEKLLNKIEKNQINIASIIEKEKDNELKMRAYSLFVKMCPEKFISKIDDEDVLIHFEQYRSLYQIGMNIFDCASERLKNNREFVLKFLKVVKSSDLRFLDYLNEQLKNDKDIVMEAIVQMHYSDDSGKALKSYFEKVNKKFREDKDIMLTAIKYDGEYFEFVHEQLKNDKNFILEAIKRNKAVTKYIDIKKYSDDKEIIMAVHDLKYASDRLRDDEDVALDAIKHNQKYEQLEYVSGRLKNNEKFILCTIKKDAYPSILTLIDKRFSDNKQIALKVIRLEGIGEIKHISPRLKFNPAFVIESFVGRLIEKGR